MNELLEYDAGAVAAGEIWRIVTCHVTHWTPEHLAWDLGAFLLLLLAARHAGIPWRPIAVALALAAVAIPLALPGVARYRGLSGIDSALFALVAAHLGFDRASRPIALVALLTLFAKIGYELSTGTALFVPRLGAGVVPVPMAHLAGALAGLVAAQCSISTIARSSSAAHSGQSSIIS